MLPGISGEPVPVVCKMRPSTGEHLDLQALKANLAK